MTATTKIGIGTSLSRVDGAEKVTGKAKYAAEYNVPGLLYGVTVSARIAKGASRTSKRTPRAPCRAWSTSSAT
ncbi:hypothetical protein ACFSHP_23440 [Novosphingobium panipatense]